ncbi:hypothetical protein BDV23DRAFT_164890 [Aspergillus alliaceus]|uniref:Zn(2)-C6 fungal-type domain-containing protein n=1 Tax=Petromyces alliaceus TaxID=209559 RepID=A0A5N7BUG8_PETAA|nr:hypothetical protein BDV23DRAFT_164890 [Aspergillus alliaceus]
MTDQSCSKGPALACDLCFARKVRCDRREPCKNCVDSRVRCVRTRPKRPRKQRTNRQNVSNDRIPELVERLSRLEDSQACMIASSGSFAFSPSNLAPGAPNKSTTPSNLNPNGGSDVADLSLESIRNTPCQGTESQRTAAERVQLGCMKPVQVRQLDVTCHCPGASEARSFILSELQTLNEISTNRLTALESALAFVEQMSNGSAPVERHPENSEGRAITPTTPTPKPPPQAQLSIEFLYTMMNDHMMLQQRTCLYEYTFYIPAARLEKMALALIEGKGTEQTLLQYTVCVHCKVFCYLISLPISSQSPAMRAHLLHTAQAYMDSALTALNRVSLTTLPSLTLVQTLLSGAVLLQYSGNGIQCWPLVAHASIICKALGWQHSNNFTFDPLNEAESEVLAVVYQCYVLDKAFSMNLCRPVCLPGLEFLSSLSPSNFVPEPFSPVVEGILRHAQVQEALVQYLQPSSTSCIRQVSAVEPLVQDLKQVKAKYDQSQLQAEKNNNHDLRRHFLALDFVHFSLSTVIYRYLACTSKNNLAREKCLAHAREALWTIKRLREHLQSLEQGLDFCQIFITWSMLMFPLTPFFVVFCNIITTSYHQDFHLLQSIVDLLGELSDVNPSMSQLHKLCSTFVGFCTTLFATGPDADDHTTLLFRVPRNCNGPLRSTSATVDGITTTDDLGLPIPQQASSLCAGNWNGISSPEAAARYPTDNANRSKEDIFWQLFDAQPTLDWLQEYSNLFRADVM